MNLTWYGTASLKITHGKTAILFDPFFSLNPAIPEAKPGDFSSSPAIFITHGHFDHLMHLPEIMKHSPGTVYCGPTVAVTLRRLGIASEKIIPIIHGNELKIGTLTVRAYRSRHIQFDLPLIVRTIFNVRMITCFKNLKTIIPAHRSMPMGEVFGFEIIHKKTNILHFGSLGYDAAVQYPSGPTVLTIPYQGRCDLEKYAIEFVQRFQPKNVFIHHFDDTFPPISSAVDIAPFLTTMRKNLPHTPVIVPEYGKPVRI